MTLQGNLRIEFANKTHILSVKSILLKGVYYFFINDIEKGHPLLSGQTLELVYADQFIIAKAKAGKDSSKISPEVITAIQEMLLENKQLWFYKIDS